MADRLLDTSESKLILEGTPEEQKRISSVIAGRIDDLRNDRAERSNIYRKRRDFYEGNHGDYSNLTGIIKDTKQKKGHTNQVTNYAGKTTVKIAMGLANNPPKFTIIPEDITDESEVIKAQAVEDFIDSVLDDKLNRFWKKTYRRSSFIQAEYADAAIKTYLVGDKIKLCGHDDMSTIMVMWNGNPGEYDGVIAEMQLSPAQVYEQYGVKVNEKMLAAYRERDQDFSKIGSHNDNQWATKGGTPGKSEQPSGKNRLPTIKVIEYDTENEYAIKIEGELVQYIQKDDVTYPKIKYWTIVPNVPNPPSPWSIADIDYLMDPQIEINDNDNRSSDHLRVGNVQRYVAYNMSGFDPNSIKTTSGQVIFVNSTDGSSRFEPLQTNINNFPDDQYHNRKMQQIYDMGLPKVNYGASGSDSGRSKAMDYQSSIDLTNFKRDAWELSLQDIFEKIQIFGNFLYGEQFDWFQNENGEFVVRNAEFDWTDILPVSASDKIVNIANKVNMIGISIKTALKELGYRNPDKELELLKQELRDPDLMILRSKMWQLSGGILMAQNQAAVMSQSNADETMPSVNQSSPTLTSSQNSDGAKPMAAKGGTTSYSSSQGAIEKARQNTAAKGG